MEIEKCASGCASRGHYVVAPPPASSEAVHGEEIPSEAETPSPPLARRMPLLKQVSSGRVGGSGRPGAWPGRRRRRGAGVALSGHFVESATARRSRVTLLRPGCNWPPAGPPTPAPTREQ